MLVRERGRCRPISVHDVRLLHLERAVRR